MKSISLGFIGGGRITNIFLRAYQNKQIEFKSVLVYDTNAEVLAALKNDFSHIILAESVNVVAKQDIVFIALHPPAIMETVEKIKTDISVDSVIISLAPKISMEKIAGKLPSENIIRMIPNATSVINEGYNPLCFSENFSADKEQIINLLNPLGATFEVAESKLEAYAIISAMLPTYFWFQWKTVEDLGLEMGLEKREVASAIYETMIAALKTMYKSGLEPEALFDLIPVKPIGEHEREIVEIYKSKLLALYEKIKP